MDEKSKIGHTIPAFGAGDELPVLQELLERVRFRIAGAAITLKHEIVGAQLKRIYRDLRKSLSLREVQQPSGFSRWSSQFFR